MAAEVAGRMRCTEQNFINEFLTFGIDGHMVATGRCPILLNRECERVGTLQHPPHRMEMERAANCLTDMERAANCLTDMKRQLQAIALMRAPAFECNYDDRFLGKTVRITVDQRTDIGAPIHVIGTAAARLHGQKPSPSAYTRVSLWPAQLQRVAIGFTVAASEELCRSVHVHKVHSNEWRTRILNRVIGGLAGKIQVFYMRA